MTLPKKFWDKVDKTDSCWEWVAGVGKDGYGRFRVNEKIRLAHRISYEDAKGKVSKGLDLDHLCRNRKCVNPDHLEAVTHRENIQRGLTGLHQRLKTHCPQDHEYTKENTYIYSDGHRHCRTCTLRSQRQSYQRKKLLTRFN